MLVCPWGVCLYCGGLSAFGVPVPGRPVCDCLRALYPGNGSQSLFHDFGAGGIGGTTPEPFPVVQRVGVDFGTVGWRNVDIRWGRGGPAYAGQTLYIGRLGRPVGRRALLFTKLPEVQVEEETDKEAKALASAPDTVPMWRHPQFVRAIVAQFCYCAAQTGIFSFFINYVTEADTTMTDIEASRILAFGGMALFMIGRLSGSFTMGWMSPARLLTWFALADVVCMVLVVMSLGTVSLYALYLSFFFMSIMFPTIFALGLEGMGGYTKKASSYIVMGVAGGAFAPMLMGYIGADNMAAGFVVPLAAFLYILYFALRCGKIRLDSYSKQLDQ